MNNDQWKAYKHIHKPTSSTWLKKINLFSISHHHCVTVTSESIQEYTLQFVSNFLFIASIMTKLSHSSSDANLFFNYLFCKNFSRFLHMLYDLQSDLQWTHRRISEYNSFK